MPAFPRRVRLALLGLAALACLLALLPWATYVGGSPHAWDITTPWLAGAILSVAVLVLLVLPVPHADLLAVVAACLAAALGVAGLLQVSGHGGDLRVQSARTVPAATAFFIATSDVRMPRDSLRLGDGVALTAAARAGLCMQVLLAGAALLALRQVTTSD